MALEIGELKEVENEDMSLDGGMSLEIYNQLDSNLSTPLQKEVEYANKLKEEEGKEKAVAAAQEALDKARLGWKKLAYSIAYGVIKHIKSNMEIKGITAGGSVTTVVSGSTGQADDVVFTQNNDGTGHVQ